MSMPAEDKHQMLAGQQKIDWASRQMPISELALSALVTTGKLTDTRIALGLSVDAKSAFFAQALCAAGVDVHWQVHASHIDDEILQALRGSGVCVYIDDDTNSNLRYAKECLQQTPDYLIENGAQLFQLAHTDYPEVASQLKGAIEISKPGLTRVTELASSLRAPVIDVANSRISRGICNTFGVGQSAVMAMLDVTNLQIAGRHVLVIGYGSIGRGIASHAAAMGARVTVAEIDPVKAMQAQYDGFSVSSVRDAAPQTEVVFTATNGIAALRAEELGAMPDGVFVCAAGCGQNELPMHYFDRAVSVKSVRADVTDYEFSNNLHVLLIAEGHCVHTAAGSGVPIEIADKMIALQAHALQYLLMHRDSLATGIVELPASIEAQIALAHLEVSGASMNAVV